MSNTVHDRQRLRDIAPGVLHFFDPGAHRAGFISSVQAGTLGYTQAQIDAFGPDRIEALMHPDDRPRFAQHLEALAALDDRSFADLRYRLRDSAGRWRRFQSRDAVYERDPQGAALRFVGSAMPIDDPSPAGSVDARLAAIVDSSDDAIIGKTLEGLITNWNHGAQLVFGYTAEQALGRSMMMLMPPERADEERQILARIARGETIRHFESVRVRADGARITIAATISAIRDADGTVIGASTVARDITERKRAEQQRREHEQRLQLATAAGGVGIWEWDLVGNRIRWDAMMFRIYGLAPTADGFVEYETWRGAVLPEEIAAQEQALQATIASRGEGSRQFRIIRRDDGQCRTIRAAETVRVDELGQPQWVIGTNLDVTAAQQLQQAFRDASQRKDEFLATLAHELRNPLAPMRNALELMKHADAGTALFEQARAMIERQIAQMVRMIDDLLDVSRITRDRLELKKERVALATVVRDAIEACRPQFERAGHDLQVRLPGAPLYLNADPMRLTQVLINLLTNASKYTDSGGNISLEAQADADAVLISVSDDGIGIPPDMLTRVFDLFTQVNQSLNRSQGGLGIGLSLVQRLVELHGGTVVAHSEGPDRGSRFVVRLPLPEVLLDAFAVPPAAPVALPAAGSRRVLVVDDNRDAAESMQQLLTMAGHCVEVAHDGAQALDAVAAFAPQVVLLDIGLPVMNGYDTCRAIRRLPGGDRIAIHALTGWGQDEDRRRSREAGFDGHLVKPAEYATLMQLLAQATPAER